MKAVIMAGGEGTRLRPLTSRTPKPMMPVANKPMMEHIVALLRRHGFTEIVVTLAFMPDAIRNWFGDGSDYGVRFEYAIEEHPLGTAGSVRNAAHLLGDEQILVISGDVLTDIDLGQLVKNHGSSGAVATIGLTEVANPLEFGIVITDESGSIERFLEKPSWGQVFSDTINTGIFVLEPEVLDGIEPGQSVDFSSDVFPALLASGAPLHGSVAEGYWEDVGTLDAYLRAHTDVLDGAVSVDIDGFELAPSVWVGDGVEIDPEATIEGPAIIGDQSRVDAGARVGEYAVIGANVRLRAGATLERSIIHDHTHLGYDSNLRGAVVGRSGDIRPGARLEDGVVLGDECFVGEGAVLSAGVQVYPSKIVEAGAIVNSSIIWESRAVRSLFGREGIHGLANLDLTPELAVRVAMAWATTLPAGATVVASRDTSRAARMLKRSISAGLNASGINMLDLEVAPVPLTRSVARWPRVMGGVSIRLDADDAESVSMRFVDANGEDLDDNAQRKLERILQRQDFRRAMGGEIGEIDRPARVVEYYAGALESAVDIGAIGARHFKLVVDYSFGSTSHITPTVFAKLGADVLALNPYAATLRAAALDTKSQTAELSRLVSASGASLGAAITADGERLFLVDDRGRVLSDTQAALAMISLTVALTPGKVAMPVSAPKAAAEIIQAAGGEVVWTHLAGPATAAGDDEEVIFATDLEGGYVIGGFLPAFDATAALLKLLELLSRNEATLADTVDHLPPTSVSRESIKTPWELKGTLMRRLVERFGDRETVLVDGVKVLDETGWTLFVPDRSEPLTHIWAEDKGPAASRRRAHEAARLVRSLIR